MDTGIGWLAVDANWSAARSTTERVVARLGDRGSVMTEYGALAFFVCAAAVGVLAMFGGEIVDLFRQTQEGFDAARTGSP